MNDLISIAVILLLFAATLLQIRAARELEETP